MRAPTTPFLPLAGVRVLECTGELGALAGTILAALGASVTRIEGPATDPLRTVPCATRGPRIGESLTHLKLNRGKTAAALPPGATAEAMLRELLERCDVLLWDETAPHAARLEASLGGLEAPPILVHIRGFPGGSARDRAPYTDLTLDAAGGQLYLNGFPDRPPAYPAGNQAYNLASLVAAAGALASLVARRGTGKNHRIDVAAQEAVALSTVEQANVNQWHWYHETPTRLGAETRGHGGLMQCADGKWVILNINEGRRVLRWFEDAGLGTFGPEWDDYAFWIDRYDEQIAPRLRTLVASHDAATIVRLAQSYRLLTMPVAGVDEVLANEQLRDRGFWEHDDGLPFHRLPWTVIGLPAPGSAYPLSRSGRGRELTPEHAALDDPTAGGTGDGHSPASAAGARPSPTTDRPLPLSGRGKREGDVGAVSTHLNPHFRETGTGGEGRNLLAGLRILEFCGGIAGPLTTRFFANLGAEVIKVESDDPPDVLRVVGLQPPQGPSRNANAVFNDCNTGKLSLGLNLRSPEAVGIVKDLIPTADAIVTSFTPGVLDRFGLGFEDAARLNPRIVYYASSVYGTAGPLAGYRSYGSGITAAAGLSLVMGEPGEPPAGLGNYHSDYTGPYFSAIAVLAALCDRTRRGGAIFIDFSQVEGAVWLHGADLLEYADTGATPLRPGNRSRHMAPHGLFRCGGDDEWCAVAVRSDAEWQSLCDAVGLPGLAGRFPTLRARLDAAEEIERTLAPWFRARTKWDAAILLTAAGIPASPVENNRDLALDDDGLRDLYTPVEHPEGPRLAVMREPMRIDGARPEAVRAPLFGEHTDSLLKTLLGFDEGSVDALYASGAIG